MMPPSMRLIKLVHFLIHLKESWIEIAKSEFLGTSFLRPERFELSSASRLSDSINSFSKQIFVPDFIHFSKGEDDLLSSLALRNTLNTRQLSNSAQNCFERRAFSELKKLGSKISLRSSMT